MLLSFGSEGCDMVAVAEQFEESYRLLFVLVLLLLYVIRKANHSAHTGVVRMGEFGWQGWGVVCWRLLDFFSPPCF